MAYGVSSDSSDMDVYGICIPPRRVVFPHTVGILQGFGNQGDPFNNYQQHHIKDPDALGGAGREYDLDIYNIVRFFQLALECNPNVVDCLFTHETMVLHSTAVGQMIRQNRHLFLHKGVFAKYKGYAYSQEKKIDAQKKVGNRVDLIEEFGYDTKAAYHLCRLLDQGEQLLMSCDMDLMRAKEMLKSIRRGEWTREDIRQHFASKLPALETLFARTKLPDKPREQEIKQLLFSCLEHYYGSLDKTFVNPDQAKTVLRQIQEILDDNRGALE